MWMGGVVPLGYEVRDRKLAINDVEAATVRMIFERFVAVGSATALARSLIAEGVRSRRGRPIDKGFLYKLLSNRIYIGDTVHKGTAYMPHTTQWNIGLGVAVTGIVGLASWWMLVRRPRPARR